MQKTLRFVAVVLFLIATFAFASTPKTAAASTPKTHAPILHEGTSPVPLCWPGTICNQ
jgi:hypothetical protein